ncbi:hypothetical protein WS72_13395 [Burkholderia savannae]|uniref:Tlde1 domain-containing protein n=1 Tax=Burkholderia savannae TaxID=1637837 RepID=A0ABR5TJF8_9BURK|nr:DUF2778 domain-containing protein [Burkholderia savannae]KWZ43752.1 hypothetical protein WS72_13395 [Burkholderia savannae]
MPGITCTFRLNGQPMSVLNCAGIGAFFAFSGLDRDINKPGAVAHANSGPLPPGRYYIVDRQSGGRMGWFWDHALSFAGRSPTEWFALFRIDATIDDFTVINGVRRGRFRLHPKGGAGISQGCITVANPDQFKRLRSAFLQRGATVPVPGTNLKAYGTVDVQ